MTHDQHYDHYHAPCAFCADWRSVTIFSPDDEFLPMAAQLEQVHHLIQEHTDRLPSEEAVALRAASSDEVLEHMLREGNRAVYGCELIPVARMRNGSN